MAAPALGVTNHWEVMKKSVLFCLIFLTSEVALSASDVEAVLSNNTEDAPPLLVHVKPAYPKSALASGTTGSCSVIFDINHDQGRVENVKIFECIPKGVFEESCLGAVNKWWFRPPSTIEEKVITKSLSATCSYH